jgi:hypothetical protein
MRCFHDRSARLFESRSWPVWKRRASPSSAFRRGVTFLSRHCHPSSLLVLVLFSARCLPSNHGPDLNAPCRGPLGPGPALCCGVQQREDGHPVHTHYFISLLTLVLLITLTSQYFMHMSHGLCMFFSDYPWGELDTESPKHSDLSTIRDLIFRLNLISGPDPTLTHMYARTHGDACMYTLSAQGYAREV